VDIQQVYTTNHPDSLSRKIYQKVILFLSSKSREGVCQKSEIKFLLEKELFEILHFYSTRFSHPLSPPSVVKLEG